MRIDRSHFVADRDVIARARAEFAERRCAVLPQLLSPALLDIFFRQINAASWETKRHLWHDMDLGRDLSLPSSNVAVHGLQVALNNPLIFEAIREISGGPAPSGFAGRIYRQLPGSGDHLDWHDDIGKSPRLVGLSVNLAEKPYQGGVFRIRSAATKEILGEISHSTPGSAHIFQVEPTLEHSVSAVEGDVPRTAFAGWFHPSESILRLILSLAPKDRVQGLAAHSPAERR